MSDMVIAGGYRESAEFIAQEDLPQRTIVRSRDSLLGRRVDRVHLLEGFFRRSDQPAWRSHLRALLRRSPRTQILVWKYDTTGFTHAYDVRVDALARLVELEANSTRPEPLVRPKPIDPVPETEVTGQIPIEEAIAAADAEPPTNEDPKPADEDPKPVESKSRKRRQAAAQKAPAPADDDGFGDF